MQIWAVDGLILFSELVRELSFNVKIKNDDVERKPRTAAVSKVYQDKRYNIPKIRRYQGYSYGIDEDFEIINATMDDYKQFANKCATIQRKWTDEVDGNTYILQDLRRTNKAFVIFRLYEDEKMLELVKIYDVKECMKKIKRRKTM